jgi:branched-chain amino acid transport system ATP-binding protein
MIQLKVNGVSKSFGGLKAVNNVSFDVREKEIVGLIGPNGSGKTTLFNLISGYLRCDSGRIIFCGEDITNLDAFKICKKGICKTFQLTRPFHTMTVIDNVTVGALLRVKDVSEAKKKAMEVLELVGLSKKAQRKPSELNIVERKKLEFARAFATGPRMLLLDEVLAGLNATEIQDALACIKKINKQGVTIFMIEHVMRAVMSICARIIVLNHGIKIAEGTPQEVSRNESVIKAYLGEKMFA